MSKSKSEQRLDADRFRTMANEATDPLATKLIGEIADELEAQLSPSSRTSRERLARDR